MIKKLARKYYDRELPMIERTFNIVVLVTLAASVLDGLLVLLFDISNIRLLLIGAAIVGMIFAMMVVEKTHKTRIAAMWLCILVNCVLFPLMFFLSGGINSSIAIWFVLGIAFVFLMFSGKHCYIMLAIIYSIILTIFMVAYRRPESIRPLKSSRAFSIDVLISLLIVSAVIGIYVYLTGKMYEEQRQLMQQQKQELIQANKMKSSFLANMSHEIRTPVNTIIGLNEMILRDSTSEEVVENAVYIQNASKTLLALINDVLDLSKIESGKMEIVPSQYETGVMFSELVNIVWARAHEKNLELKLDISKELPSMLYGDEIRLKQVLINILTNAIKYTPTGGVTLSADCRYFEENKVLLNIAVKDTGIGIKKEELSNLFQSFQRLDAGKTRTIEGTGLGLSISKNLIELMGGTISVDSIYQKGTTFTISVVQDIIDVSPIGNLSFMTKNVLQKRKKYRKKFEAPEARILIVDDNEMNLLVAKKLLRDTKVQIDTAINSKECLEWTLQNEYHVILMDHLMPGMDGIETLQKVREQANGLCKETPVIALTANVIPNADSIYRQYGFQGYLAKPINAALLEATLLKSLPTELIEGKLEPSEEESIDQEIIRVSDKRRSVVISTDCVCDLAPELMKKFGVDKMFYYVDTDRGHFCDIAEITSDNLLEYIADGKNKTRTTQATIEEYESYFAEELQKGEKVIHISVASRTSDGYQAAMSAAQSFNNVEVVDSGHLSSGLGLMVLYAAKMAKDGSSYTDIMEQIQQLRHLISTTFIVPNLNTLCNNDKVSVNLNKLCKMLDLHVVFKLRKNKITLGGVEGGVLKKAYFSYIRKQLKGRKDIDTRILYITYAGCSIKCLKEIQEEVKKYKNFEHVVIQKASATISSNCGSGAFGLIYMKKKNKDNNF